MKTSSFLIATLAATLVLGGCASRGQTVTGDGSGSSGSDASGGVSSGSADPSSSGAGTPIPDASGAGGASGPGYSLSDKTVFFPYDGVDVDAAGQNVVNNYGRYLAVTPNAKLRLEGHADERGSREYNIALGERRAQAVARGLKSAGASDGQMSLLSYGEDRPLSSGHEESDYARNRRVEIIQ